GQNFVQLAISVPIVDAVKSYLKLSTNADHTVWSCPNRPVGLPYLDRNNNQYIIGYEYMGGVTNWFYAPARECHSPVKLTSSKAYWVLAADMNMNVSGKKWTGSLAGAQGSVNYIEYGNVPPHPNKGLPAGGNEVFADGSARWCQFQSMCRFNHFAGLLGPTDIWWYQDSDDFSGTLINNLGNLQKIQLARRRFQRGGFFFSLCYSRRGVPPAQVHAFKCSAAVPAASVGGVSPPDVKAPLSDPCSRHRDGAGTRRRGRLRYKSDGFCQVELVFQGN